MISPPRIQRSSTCLWMVLLDSSEAAKCVRKGVKHFDEFSTGRKILFRAYPTHRPSLKIRAVRQRGGASMGENWHSPSPSYRSLSHACTFPRVLNQCHPVPGFIYERTSFADDGQTVLIPVRLRKRSAAICSGCPQPQHRRSIVEYFAPRRARSTMS